MLLLKSVIPGCIELTLQVPPSVYQKLFPLTRQQEAAIAALGILKISAGDYQYPPTRDEGDNSDHKDDHTDEGSDSGNDTRNSTILPQLNCWNAKT